MLRILMHVGFNGALIGLISAGRVGYRVRKSLCSHIMHACILTVRRRENTHTCIERDVTQSLCFIRLLACSRSPKILQRESHSCIFSVRCGANGGGAATAVLHPCRGA